MPCLAMEANGFYSSTFSPPDSQTRLQFSHGSAANPNTPHTLPSWSPTDHECLNSSQFQSFSSDWPLQVTDDGAAAASTSKSHSEAEKRRRDRINSQLARLRKLIPRSEKMDKAALLGSSLDHVKELKRKAMEATKSVMVPSEIDEAIVEDCLGTDELIKATLCCEDKPEVFMDLNRTLKGLKLMPVGAEISCLGGRVKTILILRALNGKEDGVSVASIKNSLKASLNRIASFCSSSSPGYRLTSRRQRLLFPPLS